jgi:hypothetical protein
MRASPKVRFMAKSRQEIFAPAWGTPQPCCIHQELQERMAGTVDYLSQQLVVIMVL